MPSGIGFTIPPQEFRNERYTVCKQVGTGREVAFEDNWRERGEANPAQFWFSKAKNYLGWYIPREKEMKKTVVMKLDLMMRSQWKKVRRRHHLLPTGLRWSRSSKQRGPWRGCPEGDGVR